MWAERLEPALRSISAGRVSAAALKLQAVAAADGDGPAVDYALERFRLEADRAGLSGLRLAVPDAGDSRRVLAGVVLSGQRFRDGRYAPAPRAVVVPEVVPVRLRHAIDRRGHCEVATAGPSAFSRDSHGRLCARIEVPATPAGWLARDLVQAGYAWSVGLRRRGPAAPWVLDELAICARGADPAARPVVLVPVTVYG